MRPTIRPTRLRPTLLCAFWAGFFALAVPAEARYGILVVDAPDPRPPGLRILARREGDPAETILKVGRNLLASGLWRLGASRGGPEEWSAEIELAGGAEKRVSIAFPAAGWSLEIRTRKPNWDLWRGHQRLLMAREKRILLTNLSPGPGEWTVRDGERFALVGLEGGEGQKIVWIPHWQHPRWTPLACGLLGLVPGLNYLVHFPNRGAGFIFASALIFHFATVALVLSRNQELRELSTSITPVPAETLAGVMISASIVHGLLSWAGARSDLHEFESRFGASVSWMPGHSFEAKASLRF
jgi:hypothetical protein